jgi:PPOX class probable F420-dependent enzyme
MIDPRSLCRRPRGIVAKSNIPGPRRDRTSWQPKRTRMPALTQLHGERYLNLETFRKSGAGVRTPVWFAAAPAGAPDAGTIYVYTMAGSGKAKRIRRHPAVKVAACGARGTVTGPWIDARAEITGRDGFDRGMRLLNHKYRPWKQLLDLFSLLSPGHRRIMLAIREPASPS